MLYYTWWISWESSYWKRAALTIVQKTCSKLSTRKTHTYFQDGAGISHTKTVTVKLLRLLLWCAGIFMVWPSTGSQSTVYALNYAIYKAKICHSVCKSLFTKTSKIKLSVWKTEFCYVFHVMCVIVKGLRNKKNKKLLLGVGQGELNLMIIVF